MDIKYCMECGERLPVRAKFCSKCGEHQVEFSMQKATNDSVMPQNTNHPEHDAHFPNASSQPYDWNPYLDHTPKGSSQSMNQNVSQKIILIGLILVILVGARYGIDRFFATSSEPQPKEVALNAYGCPVESNFELAHCPGGTKKPADVMNNFGIEPFHLGDGFNYDGSEIMTVKTKYKQYLRGQVRSRYTGSTWEVTELEMYASLGHVDKDKDLDLFYDFINTTAILDGDRNKFTQDITMKTKLPYPIFWGAYPIQKVNNVYLGDENLQPVNFVGDFMYWNQLNEELHYDQTKNSGYPKSYSLTSNVQRIDEEKLRRVDLDFVNSEIDQYRTNRWITNCGYLDLPEDYSTKVKNLALKITKDKDNPYDKVKAIEQYLKTNYRYKNHPDRSFVKSRDFVEGFLFELKEGYSDYFSSAFVVMVRAIDLPARWVQGFTEGKKANEDFGQDQEDVYTIRNFDTHSWGEVLFEGYGWISFEPTPGFDNNQMVK